MPFAFGSNPRGVQATTQATFAFGAVPHRYLVSHLRQPGFSKQFGDIGSADGGNLEQRQGLMLLAI